MKSWIAAIGLFIASAQVSAQTVIVNQTPVSGGGVARWSQLWQDPGPNGNDLDGDSVCFEDFTLTQAATIDHMEWWGNGACELGFRIQFWRQDPNTIAYQPMGVFFYGGDHSVHPQATFDTTAVTTGPGPGGLTHYSLDLASPITLPANDATNVRWFVSVIGLTHQAYYTWNWSQGSGGSTRTYQFVRGMPFRVLPEGRAMLLRAAGGPNVTIAATASPSSAGFITGTGAYPAGSLVQLFAQPYAGWGFDNWTENGSVVGSNAHLSFAATSNRTLVAHFLQSHTITTASYPTYAGTTSGGGAFLQGTNVTVEATPVTGYYFSQWIENGNFVSDSQIYTFPATASHNLVAVFEPEPLTVPFDFDTAPIYTSLPIDLTEGGLTAHFSATGGGFSIQFANTMGFTPAGFAGRCIYPNSVFAADLLVSFSKPLTAFSILYSPQELGCDDSATMRVTAYSNGTAVATDTATAPAPGTWPTGRLALTSPLPFDSVVVHYDAHPPTCQDWGPIFLADHMIVSMAPATCDGDVNCDFALDGFDVEVQEKAVGGDMTDYCQPDPDFNRDFALDGFDVEAVELVVGGGACP